MAQRTELVQGTLDMLVLRTLCLGPLHGYGIAKSIQQVSNESLQIEFGSLYPALRRLELKGWISAKWETGKDRKREFKFYRLTPAGRERLADEGSNWKRLVHAIDRIMWPAAEEES